jgi:hypothetical protein
MENTEYHYVTQQVAYNDGYSKPEVQETNWKNRY